MLNLLFRRLRACRAVRVSLRLGVLWEESAQSKVVIKGLGCERTMNR